MSYRPIVIAHRGASAYLPEHSLAAKGLAYAMGADFLEQDIVASRDDELVVLHDIYLDRVSNVAALYEGRARADGRYYVRDFDLDELLTIRIQERQNADGSVVFPGRFPQSTGDFRIHTFAQELELLGSLNAMTGNKVGCYAEIKRPAWHRQQGVDITPSFLSVLEQHGYVTAADGAFVQCFDAAELERARHEFGCRLRLVQLIGDNSWSEGPTDFNTLQTARGLSKLADTVDAIGPWLNLLYRIRGASPEPTELVSSAHRAGLQVHPFTYRKDELPDGFESFAALLEFSFRELKVDGVFTDFTDLVRQAVDNMVHNKFEWH